MRYGKTLGVLALLAACGPSPEDIRELREGQAKILAKLGDLEKKVGEAPRPAAAPQRPTIDPNRVYNVPAGNSPFKGPASAPVTFVEFSDFQ
jgi:protein-disulfide isomerase